MLDRMSHKVLTFLRSQPDCTWRNNRGYHNTEIPKDEFLRTCDYLESKGYVAIDRVSGGVVSVSLTHYARHRRDFSWIAIKRWLRTGKGSMYVSLPKNERLEQDLRKFLTRENDSFGERLISLLLRLEPSQWEVLERYARELVEKKERREADTVAAAEAQYEDSLNIAPNTTSSALNTTDDTERLA